MDDLTIERSFDSQSTCGIDVPLLILLTCYPSAIVQPGSDPGGGRGHSRTEGGRTRVTYFAEKGLFLRPPHVRDFVKEGYFFVPRYEVWGSKSPYNPRNIRGSDAELLPK